MKKSPYLLALFLILSVVLVSFPQIETVKAEEDTIYIRADGSIDPLTAPISTFENSTYTLIDDIYDSIVVERNNIVIDGDGYTLQGTGTGTGISLYDRENVTIRNTQIKNFEYGIHLVRSDNNIMSANTITNNSFSGILLLSSSSSTISGNTLTNNEYGVEFYEVFEVTVSGNTMINGRFGFASSRVHNNTISGNTITNNEYGIYFWNSSDNDISGNIITNSTIRGISLTITSDFTVSDNSLTDSPHYGIFISNSSSNTVSGNTLTNSHEGIYLCNASYNTISGNNITGSTNSGIKINESSHCFVTENTITDNYDGIELYKTSNSTASRNRVTGSRLGIISFLSPSITISGNTLTDNRDGFYIWHGSYNTVSGNKITDNRDHGILHGESYNTTIFGNTLSNNGDANRFYKSSHVTVSENFISSNFIGFLVLQSSNNTFYHNNFVNNNVQVYADATNFWDNDFPSGGNYWSDYTERYPEAEELNNSTIWDTSYVINEENQDEYPLMYPYTYELIITTTAGGTTDPPAGTYYYPAGLSVNVTAFPNTGCLFDYWLLDSEERVDNQITLIMDGNHTLEALFVDVTPPTTSHDYDRTWQTSDFTITLSAIDNESGVSETYYRINGGATKTVSADGQPIINNESANNTLAYWSIDNAGNKEAPNIVTDIRLDKTNPTSLIDLTGTLGNNGWFTSDVTVSLSATDSISEVDKTEYSLDNINWNTYSAPFTIADEGNFSIYYRSTDKAGNVETTKTEIGKVDKTNPTSLIDLTGTLGNNGWFTSDVTVSLSATDSISEVDKTEYSLDNIIWETYVSPFTIADEDVFSIYYRSIDKAGNVETANIATVKLDRTGPLGSILINENAVYTNSMSVKLTLSADDKTSGVAQMRFSKDGTEWGNWETYSASKVWTLSAAEGPKTVYVQFRDNSNLISDPNQDTIILDATAPTANAGQDQKVKVDSPLIFDARASSDNFDIVSYSWDFGDGTTSASQMTIHTYNITGIYIVTLTTEDAAGNTDSAQIAVTVVLPELLPLWLIGVISAVVIIVVVVAVFFMKSAKKITFKNK